MDLRHTEFGVVVEKHASLQDGQFVLGPVPQLPQILVVERVKRVIPGKENITLRKHICQKTERARLRRRFPSITRN